MNDSTHEGSDSRKKDKSLYEKCYCGCFKHGGTAMHFVDCCNADGYKDVGFTKEDFYNAVRTIHELKDQLKTLQP